MAGANLPAKKYKKTSPTTTRMSFEFDGGATQYIDIAMALSALNRKFYRQGVYYYVNSVEIYNNETGVVDLHTIPDNYVTKNAWNRAFKLWQKMNAMADSPMTMLGRPKYHDFKVYMDELHRTTGSAVPSLHGIDGLSSTSTTTPDEWAYSQFVSADDNQDGTANADEFHIHMLGGHVAQAGSPGAWDSIGAIYSYGLSRPYPDPTGNPVVQSTSTDDPLLNVFDFSSEEQLNDIIENLDFDNDETPYDSNVYVGQADRNMQHVARIGTEVGVGRVGRASGFCAPFGLICVDPSGVSTPFRVVLNLAQGTYHGVYAERA